MSAVVWVHEDALNPALLSSGPALFVFDDAYLQSAGYSLKRVAFLYECLLELPVELARGETVPTLLAFAARHDAAELVASASPNPFIRDTLRQLAATLSVRVVEPEPFVQLPASTDLKRFSRYWTRVESRLPICPK